MHAPLRPRPEDLTYLRRLGWTVLVGAMLVLIWRSADILLLGFGSVLGAVMFRSAARMIQRAGLKNWPVSLGLGTLFVLCLFAAIGYLLTVQFGSEIGGMLGNLPRTLNQIETGLSVTPVGSAVVQAFRVATGGGAIASRLSDVVAGAGEILVNLLIVIVGALFMAGNTKPYRNAIILLTPPPGRPTMVRALDQMSFALRLWLKSKLISMAAMTIIIGGTLWLAGLKSWAALGLLGGLSEFVPFVGPAVAMLPSIGLAAAEGGDVLWRTVIAYVAVRLIEAWLLTPVVNRHVVDIPPALTLFTILAIGLVFGVYGVFFAGALLVVAFVAIREFYLRDTLGENIDGVPGYPHDRDGPHEKDDDAVD